MEINKIYCGNALEVLKTFPDESVDCIVTSPPYWALRDYGVDGQLGLEPDFNDYIRRLCDIFDECKRVLKKEGTCWVNIGDTYYTKSGSAFENDNITNKSKEEIEKTTGINKANEIRGKGLLKEKNLCLIPFRFTLEMQNRGWIVRNVIIWHKPNCMPSSVKDRFTVDFEYVFFFVKNKKYYFNQIFEDFKEATKERVKYNFNKTKSDLCKETSIKFTGQNIFKGILNGRNKRCVWTITTKPFKEAHFAVYPEDLIEPMIKAGCPENGIVLDPFIGSGTTAVVALKQNKRFIGIELNPEYVKMAENRIKPFLKQFYLII